MELSKVIIKNPEREDFKGMQAFIEAVNNQDGLELSIPEQAIEFILSKEENRERIFFALLEEKLIGFADYYKHAFDSEEANFEMIIHPAYRQQGLGSMLYNTILEKAQLSGVKNAYAYVKERLPQSVDFVQKRGFKPEKYSWKMDFELSDVDCRPIPADTYAIRHISIEDIKAYIDIMNAGFRKDGKNLYTEESFEMGFKNPSMYMFFIEQNSKPVATAAVKLEKDISRGYIHNVTVYEEFRGKGLGEMAINHCINVIKEAKLSKASLNVNGDNKNALNLYKRLGFVEIDTDITFRGEV